MKKIQVLALSVASSLFMLGSASAHVIVKPGDVTTGSFQTFTMGVPNEKGANVVKVKLTIPAGLNYVTPTVKQGWTIETEKVGEGETAKVTSITWSGGSIGAGLRDDFTFGAQAPAKATELQWKAYESYDDGVTVAWDKSEKEQPKNKDGSPDFSTSGPYSVTKVASTTADTAAVASTDSNDTTARTLSGAALLVALVAFALATRTKKTTK